MLNIHAYVYHLLSIQLEFTPDLHINMHNVNLRRCVHSITCHIPLKHLRVYSKMWGHLLLKSLAGKHPYMYTLQHIYTNGITLWTKLVENAAIFCLFVCLCFGFFFPRAGHQPCFTQKFPMERLWHGRVRMTQAGVGNMVWIRHGVQAVVWRLVHHVTEFLLIAAIV